MTIKEFKKLISRWDENDELEFYVKDNYSNYGEEAEMMIGNSGKEDWIGSQGFGGLVRLTLRLKDKDGKNSKIIYRK